MRAIVAILLLSWAALGQTGVAFDAAAIKPSEPGDVRGPTFQFTPGGGIRITNGTLKDIVEMAYDVRDFQISGGPTWLDADRYSMVATSASGGDMSQSRLRLQTLLAERFRLQTHREARELPVYIVGLARNGSKLTAPDPQRPAPGNTGIRSSCGQMLGTAATMANLAYKLSMELRRPVLDRTNLTGRYDFHLDWTPDAGPCANQTVDGPSLVTALQEELGLKLETARGPVEVLVIDRAEKPGSN